jgi:hypothetical protein
METGTLTVPEGGIVQAWPRRPMQFVARRGVQLGVSFTTGKAAATEK